MVCCLLFVVCVVFLAYITKTMYSMYSFFVFLTPNLKTNFVCLFRFYVANLITKKEMTAITRIGCSIWHFTTILKTLA